MAQPLPAGNEKEASASLRRQLTHARGRGCHTEFVVTPPSVILMPLRQVASELESRDARIGCGGAARFGCGSRPAAPATADATDRGNELRNRNRGGNEWALATIILPRRELRAFFLVFLVMSGPKIAA